MLTSNLLDIRRDSIDSISNLAIVDNTMAVTNHVLITPIDLYKNEQELKKI